VELCLHDLNRNCFMWQSLFGFSHKVLNVGPIILEEHIASVFRVTESG
jgi:hypothetical protein